MLRAEVQEREVERAKRQNSMKIVVHYDKCISAGQCVLAADDLFGQNEDDGVVVVLSEQVPAARLEAALDAARRCPTGAIEIVED